MDETFEQLSDKGRDRPHIFMGCEVFGNIENIAARSGCELYVESRDLFTLCSSCGKIIPKVCVSLGECVNCIDTDLFCIDSCMGEDSRKYCTHFVRLHQEGAHLIDNDRLLDLFPKLGMPPEKKPRKSG
ncbi:MAG TPA: hypothetical protein VLL97_13630 [Acidobacteriota bacterium]|nr:hypothetical protein [Acidobacteriota bacterium]